MDVSIGTLVGQAGTFLVLVLVTMKYVWPPLTQAMEERRQKIAEGLAQSDKAEQELDEAREQAEQIIRDARAKSGDIIENAEPLFQRFRDKEPSDIVSALTGVEEETDIAPVESEDDDDEIDFSEFVPAAGAEADEA